MKRNVFLLLFIMIIGLAGTAHAEGCIKVFIEPAEVRAAGAQFEVEDGGLFWREQAYDSGKSACYTSSGPTRVRGTKIFNLCG